MEQQISDNLSGETKKLLDVLMAYASSDEGNAHATKDVIQFVNQTVKDTEGMTYKEAHRFINMRLVLTLGDGLKYGNWLWL